MHHVHSTLFRARLTPSCSGQRVLCAAVMLLDFKSKWFQSYCRAVMESEPDVARIYIRDAFIEINERLHSSDVTASEREALSVATRYLSLILKVELAKAS